IVIHCRRDILDGETILKFQEQIEAFARSGRDKYPVAEQLRRYYNGERYEAESTFLYGTLFAREFLSRRIKTDGSGRFIWSGQTPNMLTLLVQSYRLGVSN